MQVLIAFLPTVAFHYSLLVTRLFQGSLTSAKFEIHKPCRLEFQMDEKFVAWSKAVHHHGRNEEELKFINLMNRKLAISGKNTLRMSGSL